MTKHKACRHRVAGAGGVAAVVLGAVLFAAAAVAKKGSWAFDLDARDHPSLRYSEGGHDMFFIGCGRAFGLHAVYPGVGKKDGDKASITLSNGRSRMIFAGEIDNAPGGNDPPGKNHFVQWDLGYRRQDPALYGPKWRREKERLLSLLSAPRPITVIAEGGRFTMPAATAPGWRAKFRKRC